MPDERLFGHPENIEKRLISWRRQLATNKIFPWVGTGLLDDLVCAAKLLGADVSEFTKPDQSTVKINLSEQQQPLEFDL